MQVDICLCTFMRPDLLKSTLSSIERQQLSSSHIIFKVFVVDNDVAASGEAVSSEFIKRGLIDLSYEVEPEQNIALARNRSIRMCSAEFVAFIDDDEVAAVDWLSQLCACIHRYGADAVFGPVLPIYPHDAPSWVKDGGLIDRLNYETGTAVYTGATNNALVKRSLLQSYDGPFDPAYGLTGGSDSAIFRKAAKDGAKLIWCNEATVEEFVPKERMTFRFLRKRAYRGGQSYARIFLADAAFVSKILWFFKRLFYTGGIMLMIPVMSIFGSKRLLWAVRKLYLNIGQLSVISGRYFYEYRR